MRIELNWTDWRKPKNEKKMKIKLERKKERKKQGAPLCVTCASLHRLAPLGTVLGSMVWRAQSFVTEKTGGYNISTSSWTAPYFSLGSTRVIHSASCSQASGCERASELWINSRIREGFLGLCARQRCSTCPGEHDMCCASLVCISHTRTHNTHTTQ